jgi:exopolysaccharide biosynthesis predicted pyruvyltransferase EpsI
VDSVRDYLRRVKFSGNAVYFRPNSGNAGDSLINVGALSILSEVGLRFKLIADSDQVNALKETESLILGGGGNLVPFWSGVAIFLDQIASRKCSIVLLPQSVLDAEVHLRKLRQCDVIFLRGRRSYDYVKSLNLAATVLLDDDCAFSVDPQTVLDHEVRGPRSLRDLARFALIGYHFLRSRVSGTIEAYRQDGEKSGPNKASLANDIARICAFGNQDISDIYLSAHWMLRVLSWYTNVYTDRLHVMISRVLLGRSVIVRPIAYSKIQEVIDHSISPKPERQKLVELREW